MKKFSIILSIFFSMFLLANASYASFEDPSAYMQRFEPKKNTEAQATIEQDQQKYKEELKERGYSQSVNEFISHVKKGHFEIVQLYLNAGMSPDVNYYTDHPIYYAVKGNNYAMVKLLLENGARANIGFDSPLYYAVKKKNVPIVQTLLQYGADPNFTDFMKGQTMLYQAINKGQYQIARELLAAGAKLDPYSAALIEKKKIQSLIFPKQVKPETGLETVVPETYLPLPKENDIQE